MADEKKPQGKFTLDADAIEDGIMESAANGDPNNPNSPKVDPANIERVVEAGMKLLFSETTHNKFFDQINENDDIPIEYELGKGGAAIMLLLYKESNQSIPLDAIIPAAAILLARALEYIDKTNLAPVTDQTYADAMEMMITELHKNFSEAEAAGQQGANVQPVAEGQPSAAGQSPGSRRAAAAEQPMPQAGGMLQQKGV